MGPKVSVVLPVYNQVDLLPMAVESVLSQSYRDFELIIVNDGSTDGAKEYIDALEGVDKVIHQENRKLAGALNTGFEESEGDYLTWVSSDCCCAPNFLEKLVGALDAYPEAGMAYADFFFIDIDGKVTGRVSNPDYSYRTLLVRNDGNAAFLYRRECSVSKRGEAIGPYDVTLNGAEDWDYWIRLADRFKFVYVADALYYYRLHDRSMQSTIREEVNLSVHSMMRRILEKPNAFNIDKLYPAVRQCSNLRAAAAAASRHFYSELRRRARVPVPELLCVFERRVAELSKEYDPATLEQATRELFSNERKQKLVWRG